MKLLQFSYVFLVLVCVLAMSCGKDPVPPGPVPPNPSPTPVPATAFEVKGLHIVVKGEMKKGAKVTAAEMKAAVSVAVKQLEQ